MSKIVEAIISKNFDEAEKLIRETMTTSFNAYLAEAINGPDAQSFPANPVTSQTLPGGATPDPSNDPRIGIIDPTDGEPVDDFEGEIEGRGPVEVEDAVTPQNAAVQAANAKTGAAVPGVPAAMVAGPGKPYPLEGKEEKSAKKSK